MSWLRYLLESLGLIAPSPPRGRPRPAVQQYRWEAPYRLEVDADLHASLQDMAEQEQLPVDELASDLLQQALHERHTEFSKLQAWRELSPRQQDAAALVCLGYTNQQIASRLSISPETVKTHIRSVLRRLGLRTKFDLRQMYEDWDFSAWERLSSVNSASRSSTPKSNRKSKIENPKS